MSMLTPEIIAGLDDGIREMVVGLDAAGYVTTDSGDGSKAEWMEGALPFPMVAVRVLPEMIVQQTDTLAIQYPEWSVEGSYSAGVAIVLLSQHGAQP